MWKLEDIHKKLCCAFLLSTRLAVSKYTDSFWIFSTKKCQGTLLWPCKTQGSFLVQLHIRFSEQKALTCGILLGLHTVTLKKWFMQEGSFSSSVLGIEKKLIHGNGKEKKKKIKKHTGLRTHLVTSLLKGFFLCWRLRYWHLTHRTLKEKLMTDCSQRISLIL